MKTTAYIMNKVVRRAAATAPAVLLALAALVTACDHLDEAERLEYVKPADVGRKVLIEDFTGQRCIHCPRGTLVIEQLQEQYGDAVIPVAIHSGPLGFKGSAKLLGLATDLGDEYYASAGVVTQPSGVVNRVSGAIDYTAWTTSVYNEIQKTASMDIDLSAVYDAATGRIDISVETLGTNGDTTGRLLLWVTEDSITAMQLRFNTIDDPKSGNYTDPAYVHNHVLRAAVNGTQGELYATKEGQRQQFRYQQQCDEAWVPEHLAIVGFVYNEQGVAQVEKTHVVTQITQ